MESPLRAQLVDVALRWQEAYGNAPAITPSLSELDAALLVGLAEKDYGLQMFHRSVVARGHDFLHLGKRYQVKANRPSGREGSPVTRVGKARNFDWDFLIWIHYNREYVIQESWLWTVDAYQRSFADKDRLSPDDMRRGRKIA